jgi:hypothetical protein
MKEMRRRITLTSTSMPIAQEDLTIRPSTYVVRNLWFCYYLLKKDLLNEFMKPAL